MGQGGGEWESSLECLLLGLMLKPWEEPVLGAGGSSIVELKLEPRP